MKTDNLSMALVRAPGDQRNQIVEFFGCSRGEDLRGLHNAGNADSGG
jgi:hypothetical protein